MQLGIATYCVRLSMRSGILGVRLFNEHCTIKLHYGNSAFCTSWPNCSIHLSTLGVLPNGACTYTSRSSTRLAYMAPV